MVVGVGSGDPPDVPAAGQREPSQPLVHQEIVHNGVGEAVGRDAEPGPQQRSQGAELAPDGHGHDRCAADDDREEIVALGPGLGRGVVRAMPTPRRSVHRVAVGEGGHRLHRHERADGDEERDHAALARRCPCVTRSILARL